MQSVVFSGTFGQNCKTAQNCIAVTSHWTSHRLFLIDSSNKRNI